MPPPRPRASQRSPRAATAAYMMQCVLHDWNDAECHQILSTLHQAAPPQGRVWIIERVIPGPDTPHFAKFFDINMLIVSNRRERTLEEYTSLLPGAGWTYQIVARCFGRSPICGNTPMHLAIACRRRVAHPRACL